MAPKLELSQTLVLRLLVSDVFAHLVFIEAHRGVQRAGQSQFQPLTENSPIFVQDMIFAPLEEDSKIWWHGSRTYPSDVSLGRNSRLAFVGAQRNDRATYFTTQIAQGIIRFRKRLSETQPPSSYSVFSRYPASAPGAQCPTLLFALWLRERRAILGVAFFCAVALVILTRSVFQIPWFFAAVLLAVVVGRFRFRSVCVAAIVPLTIVCLWQAKNFHRFGTLATGSWLGLSLSRNTVERLGSDELTELIRQGRLSVLAPIPALSGFDLYDGLVPSSSRHSCTGQPG